jgi:hypothetical protein
MILNILLTMALLLGVGQSQKQSKSGIDSMFNFGIKSDTLKGIGNDSNKSIGRFKFSHHITLDSIKSSLQNGRGENKIRQVLKYYEFLLQNCYEYALRQKKHISGKLTLSIIIEPSGSVTDVRIIASTLESEYLELCTKAKIKMIRFTPADIQTTEFVNATYHFID